MQQKLVKLLFFLFVNASLFAQENNKNSDTIKVNEKKWEFNIDLCSRYIWRGQSWGGNFFALQPTITYKASDRLVVGTFASTNFIKDYFYEDGITPLKGYQEIDFYINYSITSFLSINLYDYYWPTVSKVEGIDNSFFNYGPNSVKTVDATLVFDFSEGYKYPFNAKISTLVAGNDYRYDANDENPKQNFTTYIELGYRFSPFKKSKLKPVRNIHLDPILGAVLNNKAQYYTASDYDKISLVNVGCNIGSEIDFGNGITMPLSLNFIHNAASENTETYGRNFLVFTTSFSY